jgi:hypothetical protein
MLKNPRERLSDPIQGELQFISEVLDGSYFKELSV